LSAHYTIYLGSLSCVGTLTKVALTHVSGGRKIHGSIAWGAIVVFMCKSMEVSMNRIYVILFSLLAILLFQDPGMASVREIPKDMTAESSKCVGCHKKKTPSIVQQWGSSKHYGANVGC
jgi:ABC-type glucose/galactose transport system permease subunit